MIPIMYRFINACIHNIVSSGSFNTVKSTYSFEQLYKLTYYANGFKFLECLSILILSLLL